MKYLGKIIRASREVIIYYLLNYFIMIGSCLVYYWLGFKNLNRFILNILPFITMLYLLIVIGILLLQKKPEKHKLKFKNIFSISAFGVSLAIIINLLFFLIGVKNEPSEINFIAVVLSSGILGPLFEELIFRQVFLNKLLEFNNKYMAVFLNTTIFALIHGQLPSVIYAFIFGLFFNLVYLRYKNIWANIIMHISGNTIVLFLSGFNIYLFIFSFICLILSFIIVFKKYSYHD